MPLSPFSAERLFVSRHVQVQVSMIPGSITVDEFEKQKGELKNKTVVCYCTVGYRSSAHAAKLKAQGYDAKNLEGGIVRWVSELAAYCSLAALRLSGPFHSEQAALTWSLALALPACMLPPLQAQKRYPLIARSSGEETKRIHVYGKDWALQPGAVAAPAAGLGLHCAEPGLPASHLTTDPPSVAAADDYEAVMFNSPIVASVRSLLPRWLGGS